MKQIQYINGQDLREMFAAATNWLEKSSAEIDALNVFPVPDGDTGTNMLLTMRSSVEEAYQVPDNSVSVVVQAIARGALMGARGNSGVHHQTERLCHPPEQSDAAAVLLHSSTGRFTRALAVSRY